MQSVSQGKMGIFSKKKKKKKKIYNQFISRCLTQDDVGLG